VKTFLTITALLLLPFAESRAEDAKKMTRDVKLISSAGARALADACSVWAE
jgi:hypothetical protein